MKSCPTCGRVFPVEASFCPHDGGILARDSLVPVDASKDPRLGKLFSERYELKRVVADGAMGRVYEGIDWQKKIRVAVKILHPEVARDDIALERFKREYEVSKQLQHRHVVDVFDFCYDEVEKAHLLVMEFLDGEELSLVLEREQKLSRVRVIQMISQIAMALDDAHSKHFVHRDLKPDNLFLCGSPIGYSVKILDFGSVKNNNLNSKKLTVLGTTIGTPYYMSPEQVQGLDSLDGRADVFALAAISYECLAGRVPFGSTQDSAPSILVSILRDDPLPITRLVPSLPRAVEHAIEDALAKNYRVRTPTVGAFANALGHAFGLPDNHEIWAKTPHKELAAHMANEAERMMDQNPVVGVGKARDPFAEFPSSLPSPTEGDQLGPSERETHGDATPGSSEPSMEVSGPKSSYRVVADALVKIASQGPPGDVPSQKEEAPTLSTPSLASGQGGSNPAPTFLITPSRVSMLIVAIFMALLLIGSVWLATNFF